MHNTDLSDIFVQSKWKDERFEMFWLKACNECGGNLVNHEDIYGCYIACVQCARHLNEADETRTRLNLQILGAARSPSQKIEI